MSDYESYASKTSADCAAEFTDTQGKLSFWTLVFMLSKINPYLGLILESVWPVESYLHWMVGKLEASYPCAAKGNEAGFSMTDGVWEKQLSYINQNMAEIDAWALTPYYGTYVIFTNGFALKTAFDTLMV